MASEVSLVPFWPQIWTQWLQYPIFQCFSGLWMAILDKSSGLTSFLLLLWAKSNAFHVFKCALGLIFSIYQSLGQKFGTKPQLHLLFGQKFGTHHNSTSSSDWLFIIPWLAGFAASKNKVKIVAPDEPRTTHAKCFKLFRSFMSSLFSLCNS